MHDCGTRDNCEEKIDLAFIQNGYISGSKSEICSSGEEYNYGCIQGNSLKDTQIPLQNLGGRLCVDHEDCNDKLDEMGYGHCKDKKLMVYAEKCGAFDFDCKD